MSHSDEEYRMAKAVTECWKNSGDGLRQVYGAVGTGASNTMDMQMFALTLGEVYAECSKQIFRAQRIVQEYEKEYEQNA